MASYEENVRVLHWLPDEDRWEEIPWETWSKFRGVLEPGIGIPEIKNGIHHFVVCPQDETHVVNILAHKYLLDADGKIERGNFPGLTREEREDYSRILVAMEQTEEDQRKLDAIHQKLGKAYEVPTEAIEPLKTALGKPALPGSLAEKFFSRHDLR